MAHEAGDRWSLEALGIAADGDWDACLSAWLENVGEAWNNAAGREIIWRSRAIRSAELIAKILKDPKTGEGDRPGYFRALDFQPAAQREAALESILSGADSGSRYYRELAVEVVACLPAGKLEWHQPIFLFLP